MTSIKNLLQKGLIFEAFDQIQKALSQVTPEDPAYFSLTSYQALAFLQTGSLDQAYKTIHPFIQHLHFQGKPFLDIWNSLGEEDIFSFFQGTSSQLFLEIPLGLSLSLQELSHIFYELWREGWEEEIRRELAPSFLLPPTLYLHIARLLLLQAHSKEPTPFTGAHVAIYSWILGEDKLAQAAALQVRSLSLGASYKDWEAACYAFLIQKSPQEALEALQKAITLAPSHFHQTTATRHQLLLLERIGLEISPELFQWVSPPKIVVFTGPPLDTPHQKVSCFPARMEGDVRQEIDKQLEQLQAQIGYCMGAAGADLIFAEALLDRGGEINLVLPCCLEDFIRTSISYAGPRWETRFRHLLEKASSVIYATEQPLLGQQILYQFAHQVLHGVAEMRAHYFGTAPHLLALWDHKAQSLPGGAADFIDRWDSIETLHIVDLETLLKDKILAAPQPTFSLEMSPSLVSSSLSPSPETVKREIKTLLFSDLSGYSRLQDSQMADFLKMMESVAQELKNQGLILGPLNTWGDALFMVMDRAIDMALFSLALCKAIEEHGNNPHFSHPLVARISLHAGPIFSAQDAFTGRENYFGSHINRGARLEPVTMAGQVFATQQFVALLQAELGLLRSEGRLSGPAQGLRFRYVGIVDLAKNFGRQAIYQIMS